jgi:hypothetical protein
VRGVVAPAGTSQIEFRYEPASMYLGLRVAGLALFILAVWSAGAWIRRAQFIGTVSD